MQEQSKLHFTNKIAFSVSMPRLPHSAFHIFLIKEKTRSTGELGPGKQRMNSMIRAKFKFGNCAVFTIHVIENFNAFTAGNFSAFHLANFFTMQYDFMWPYCTMSIRSKRIEEFLEFLNFDDRLEIIQTKLNSGLNY